MIKRLQGGNYLLYHKMLNSNLEDAKLRSLNNGGYGVSTDEDLQKDLLRKRKERFINLCLNNDFTYFITLTYDPKGKYNNDKFDKSVKRFFKDLNEDIKYILVPEYHKSGRLHYHILCDTMLYGFYTNLGNHYIKCIYFQKWGNHDIKKIDYKAQDYERVIYYLSKYLSKEYINKKNTYSRNLNNDFREDLRLIDYDKKISLGQRAYKGEAYHIFLVPKENIKKINDFT